MIGCAGETEQNGLMETYSYEEGQDTYLLENDELKLTLDPETTYFQVLDKSNNTVWYSNPADGANDPLADNQSKKYLQSTLLIVYSNDTGINTIFNNFEFSISKKIYSVEQGDGFIKVNYTIGNVQKVYVMPSAIPESRMMTFYDQMDKSSKRKIDNYYRKLDINNLRATDDKNALLEQYPDLAQENIYVLRENTQEHLKKSIEEIFAQVGYTLEDYEEDEARYSRESREDNPFFNVSVVYRLEGNDLVVSLPFEDMQWRKDYPLIKVKVLPYLGAGSTEEEGFILVPEGTGAVINFNNGKNTQSAYYTDVYGWDEALLRDALTDNTRSEYPVFGISKSNGSMLCMLENYGCTASLEADVSGRNHSYNFAAATYTTLHGSALNLSAKTDKTVMVFEAEKPSGEIRQRYSFLDTTDYIGMAGAYRSYLMARYPELKKQEENGAPVNITLIGAIDTVKQRLGLPVSVPEALTTYKEAADILQDLQDSGYRRLSVRYEGWMNGGIKQSVPTKIKSVSELGSKKTLKDFIRQAREFNVPVYLSGMTEYAYETGALDGFVSTRDAARYTSRERIELYNFSPVYFGIEDWRDSYYLLKPQLTLQYMGNLAKAAKDYEAGVAFSDIGYVVSADYNPKNLTTRQEVIDLQTAELKSIMADGTKVMVRGGNDYALPYASHITDMKLEGTGYHILDYMVPFYSAAIHGLVDYTGVSLNLSGDYHQAVLNSAENGAGLSFTFMKESASTLQDTFYTYLFGTDYDKWKEEAYSIYSRYNEELGHCFNQYITSHERIGEGVYETGYEDGTRVYVNYNYEAYEDGGLLIPARDYYVERR
jgi:hypothetical protein